MIQLRLFCLGLIAAGTVLCSCGTFPPVPDEQATLSPGEALPEYRIIFLIHGDGGYLYHDTEGNSYRADEEAVRAAQAAASSNPTAEVFIFHEKPRKHVLFLFAKRDGKFYYYRGGELLAEESYWRDHGTARFAPELELYNRFGVRERNDAVRMFLYFGHEIPEVNGKGYDQSYDDRSFLVGDLGRAMHEMTGDASKFDLVVLSTCYGGTPHTVGALSPYARYIMASPGNLHLSYFDMTPFEALQGTLHKGNVDDFARECARKSFERLRQDIQTEISVAVYDAQLVQPYAASVDAAYNRSLAVLKENGEDLVEYCDCAERIEFVTPGMSEGVEVLFRAARFGRSAGKKGHSGWGCPTGEK